MLNAPTWTRTTMLSKGAITKDTLPGYALNEGNGSYWIVDDTPKAAVNLETFDVKMLKSETSSFGSALHLGSVTLLLDFSSIHDVNAGTAKIGDLILSDGLVRLKVKTLAGPCNVTVATLAGDDRTERVLICPRWKLVQNDEQSGWPLLYERRPANA